MSGRPRTTSFAEGNKQPLNPPLGGLKISSKFYTCPVVRSFEWRRNQGEWFPESSIASNMAAAVLFYGTDRLNRKTIARRISKNRQNAR